MDFWLTELTESTLLYTALRYLLFPLLIAIATALLANLFLPRWQDRYLRRKAREERRLELGESVLALMNIYITNWRRLIEIAQYERELRHKEAGATEGEQMEALNSALERKKEFVAERGKTRDALMDAISRYKMYCDPEVRETCAEFFAWDEGQSVKSLDNLPDIAEWREWERRIAEEII